MSKQPRIILAGLSILISVGAMIATVLILRKAAGGEASDLAGTVAWSVGPYLLLILIARLAARSTLSAGVALTGTALTTWFGVDALYNAFYSHPDAQSGLVVFALPMFQWIFCGLTVAVILAWHILKWVVWPGRGKTTTVE